MIARDLNDIDRRIAEVRQQIKEQKALIRGFEQHNDIADATQAGVGLRVLEDELSRLLARRVAILGRFRRPRSAAKPGSARRGTRSTG
jgi:septal ring factor EnvC (AmiA/AmiB activator)